MIPASYSFFMFTNINSMTFLGSLGTTSISRGATLSSPIKSMAKMLFLKEYGLGHFTPAKNAIWRLENSFLHQAKTISLLEFLIDVNLLSPIIYFFIFLKFAASIAYTLIANFCPLLVSARITEDSFPVFTKPEKCFIFNCLPI